MHVGFDLLFLIPGETGGRETYARELIDAVYRLEPGLRGTAFVNRDMSAAEQRRWAELMRVVRVPATARRPDSWAIGEIARLPVAARRSRVDVLHSLANFGPATGPFARVLTLHDLQYRTLGDAMTPSRRIATAAMIGLAARRATRIITVSHAAGDELRALTRLDPRRITVVPNGVRPAPAVTPDAVETMRDRLSLGAGAVTLTVAGNLPHKNLPLVFDALRGMESGQRPTAILAGHGTDSRELDAAAQRAGVGDHVRLLGSVGQDDLEALYALAGCLVLPTRYEGFGLPALEAMARGVPVVCSDIAPLREITGDASLRFDPDSAAQAAAAIRRVLSEPELADRLRAAGHAQAERYSWTAAATATLAVYRDALDAG